jgi:hypothetical protein
MRPPTPWPPAPPPKVRAIRIVDHMTPVIADLLGLLKRVLEERPHDYTALRAAHYCMPRIGMYVEQQRDGTLILSISPDGVHAIEVLRAALGHCPGSSRTD